MKRGQDSKIPPSRGGGTRRDEAPPQRFDGLHTGSWVRRLPTCWVPYIQLARLSPPVPILLVFFPHLFGILHAAITHEVPPAHVARVSALLFGFSFFFSNAMHGWNDLIDAPIDRLIPRTRNRPIVRGAITPRAAFIFSASQALVSTCFLPFLPEDTVLYTMPSIIADLYYPFSKRHTYFPQVVLGVGLQWAVVLGSYATGVSQAWTDKSILCLFLGCVFWTVIYDTVYGYQDCDEDIRVGVKSTAVLFGSWGKPILWVLSHCMVTLFLVSGYLAEMSWVYFAVTVGGSFASLNIMIAAVDLESPESCSWWFTYGFWGPAVSISVGLLSMYVLN